MRTRTRPRAYVAMSHPGRRRRVVALLREDGWVVRGADDGYDLVHLLNSALLSDDVTERPDLLVVDATLHGVTGLSLLQGIRELEWTTPTVVIADFNRPETLELARGLGSTHVMEKPVDPEAVRAVARAVRADLPPPAAGSAPARPRSPKSSE